MKLCKKLPEPATLVAYRTAQPQGSWDDMHDDALNGGQQAYPEIKRTLVRGQRCLCAYCEIRIADGCDDQAIDARKHEQRIEHFHPKSDSSGSVNWALLWSNMWAVCHGGSQRPAEGVPADPSQFLEPLPANLSCDSFKEHQISAGRLSTSPEGWILSPADVPAFPVLLMFDSDGTVRPHIDNCADVTLPNNHYPDTATLVASTIEHLNLACVRLSERRRIAGAGLEKQIKRARDQAPGVEPATVLTNLARRLFSGSADSPWVQFFTLIRWRLGEAAEAHLESINYSG